MRLASFVALPTDEEIDEAGAAGAGQFLLSMRENAPKEFIAFVRERTLPLTGAHPRERVHRCVGALLDLVLSLIGHGAKSVSELDAEKLVHERADGHALRSGKRKCSISGKSLIAALSTVEKHIHEALQHVPAFAGFSAEQLRTLRDAMSIDDFESGEYVFNQGDAADSFYLITTGYAEVLLTDPNDPDAEEVCLATLGPSDSFGELALLYNEPRATSIMADGRLFVLYITREEFERALGKQAVSGNKRDILQELHDENDRVRQAEASLLEHARDLPREVERRVGAAPL